MELHEVSFPQITQEVNEQYLLKDRSVITGHLVDSAVIAALQIRMIHECAQAMRTRVLDITRTNYDDLKAHIQNELQRDCLSLSNIPTTEQKMNPDMCITFYHIKENITSTFENIDRDEDLHDEKQISVGLMYNRYHRIRIFKTGHNLAIISNRPIMDNNCFIKLCAALPAMFPHILEGIPLPVFRKLLDTDLTEWHTEMSAYLTGHVERWNSLKDIAIIELFAQQQKERVHQTERELSDRQDRYNRYCTEMINAAKEIETLRQTLWGMQNTETKNNVVKEFLAYARKHPNVKAIEADRNSINIVFTTTLSLYDEGLAKRVIESRLKSYDKDTTHYAGLIAMKKIFLDRQADFLITEQVNVSFGGSVRGYNFNSVPGIMNPHHFFYNCWGNYPSHILKALTSWQLPAMLEQIHSALRSLNWADGAVIGNLTESFMGTRSESNVQNISCIRENGTVYSIRNYRNKIKEELSRETN